MVGDRSARLQRDREEFTPGGQKGRVDITLQLNSFDPGALLFAQSHRDAQTPRGRARTGERLDLMIP